MRKPSRTLAQVEQEVEQTPVEDKRTEEKKFEIFRTPIGLYALRWTGGGELPDNLKGTYTSKNFAQAMVDKYFADIEFDKKSYPSMFGMENISGEVSCE